MILNQPKFKLLYNDFYQDTILNIKGGDTASKAFNVNINRPRTLYIIPFLSNQNIVPGGFMTNPYLSPVSSAQIQHHHVVYQIFKSKLEGKISLVSLFNITINIIMIMS